MAIDYERELNAEQLAVVREGDGACVVLAGAGSGKTRTVVYRVAWLLEHGVRPEEVLLLTFTNKAAAEMMSRIGERLPGRAATGIWGGTFHSIANRILRSHCGRLGYGKSFTILDQDDAKSLLKACMKEAGVDRSGKRFPSPAVVLDVISYSRNARIPIETCLAKRHPSFAPFGPDVVRIAERYASRKKTANAMDFDDLLTNLLALLDDDAVRRALSSRFRYLLVDEFQDTNSVQSAIVDALASVHGNILAVGDDAQSIYSFRAADIRNILEFPTRHPGGRIFTLTTNYRSTPEILNVANEIIAGNANQFSKALTSVAKPDEKPAVETFASSSREARWLVDAIEAELGSGTPPREIAALFRATHHSQVLEFELMRRGIAYEYRGGLRFFERAHVKDALAFLRVRENVADETAWLRLLAIQVGIGDATAARVVAAARASGELERALCIPESTVGGRAAKGWGELVASLTAVAKSPVTPADQLRAVLKTPYVQYLEAEYPNWLDRVGDLEQLAAFAEGYDDVASFLADATLDSSGRAGPTFGSSSAPQGPRIVLSTVHQAKGLEWDTVFVMHLNAASFPNRRAAFEDGGMEEERRLFYVAATRARKRLVLTYPMSVGRDEFGVEPPSPFLTELPRRVLDWPQEASASDMSYSSDSGYEEPSVALDDGRDVGRIAARVEDLKKTWKEKSFLRDV
jgi:DNA helicase-2/ATP-dependent DNA helicase PcrA